MKLLPKLAILNIEYSYSYAGKKTPCTEEDCEIRLKALEKAWNWALRFSPHLTLL